MTDKRRAAARLVQLSERRRRTDRLPRRRLQRVWERQELIPDGIDRLLIYKRLFSIIT